MIANDAVVIAETAKELTKERIKKPVAPLMIIISVMLNVLNIGAEDGRKTTPLMVWKNRQDKKLSKIIKKLLTNKKGCGNMYSQG